MAHSGEYSHAWVLRRGSQTARETLANVTFKVGGNEVVITDRLSFPADLKKGPSIREVVRAFFDQCVPYIDKVELSKLSCWYFSKKFERNIDTRAC